MSSMACFCFQTFYLSIQKSSCKKRTGASNGINAPSRILDCHGRIATTESKSVF